MVAQTTGEFAWSEISGSTAVVHLRTSLRAQAGWLLEAMKLLSANPEAYRDPATAEISRFLGWIRSYGRTIPIFPELSSVR